MASPRDAIYYQKRPNYVNFTCHGRSEPTMLPTTPDLPATTKGPMGSPLMPVNNARGGCRAWQSTMSDLHPRLSCTCAPLRSLLGLADWPASNSPAGIALWANQAGMLAKFDAIEGSGTGSSGRPASTPPRSGRSSAPSRGASCWRLAPSGPSMELAAAERPRTETHCHSAARW